MSKDEKHNVMEMIIHYVLFPVQVRIIHHCNSVHRMNPKQRCSVSNDQQSNISDILKSGSARRMIITEVSPQFQEHVTQPQRAQDKEDQTTYQISLTSTH